MKVCDICKEGVANHIIEDTRYAMEILESKPGMWIGDMNVCDYCMEKIADKGAK
jgi:hypothetical protein